MILRALLPLFLFMPCVAFAHHPMAGAVPRTFGDGFLSGIGHPFLDEPHGLVFAFAALLAARYHHSLYTLPLAFSVSLLSGIFLSFLHVASAFSLIVLICLFIAITANVLLRTPPTLLGLTWGGAPTRNQCLGVAALVGLLHGMLYGEMWVGYEPTPFVAYVIGLVVIHYAIIQGTALVLRNTVLLHQPKATAAVLTIASLLIVAVMVLNPVH